MTRHPDACLDGVLDGVRDALGEAAAHVDVLCRTVEFLLAAPATEVDDLRPAFRALTTQFDGMLVGAGDPVALRGTGRAWVDEIGAPVSALIGIASEGVLQTDDHWAGVAADAYRATLPAQRTALAAIVNSCQEVDAALDDLASAILEFWIAIGAACLGLVLTLAGALGSAATAVGAPIAAGLAVAGLGALGAAGSAALSDLTAITTGAASRSAALHRHLADSTAFPLGAWPRSTAAGVTGADGWQIR